MSYEHPVVLAPDGLFPLKAAATMDLMDDARRQLDICNACRYCEGFCSVFPAMMRQTNFADGDISHLANLCHNCRGCSYSCQYTAPHEFALNIPAVLAEVRQDSWERHVWPAPLARAFHERGVVIMLVMLVAISIFFGVVRSFGPTSDGEGFYAYLSHNLMVAIFAPAFFLPLIGVAIGLRRYWCETGGKAVRVSDIKGAFLSIAKMKNLAGGHGEGCNFEKEDRYSNARRYAHQATMYGFLLCFAATSVATLMHYLLAMEAPYPLFSLPKVLGLSGGVLLTMGSAKLAVLKLRADPSLGVRRAWGSEMAFVLLLCIVAVTGLALYVSTGTAWVGSFLAVHLGAVFTFFILLPWTKMVHGFFRLAALIIEEQKRRA